jgi:enoyl-CoA hydratase/carnithine racemase
MTAASQPLRRSDEGSVAVLVWDDRAWRFNVVDEGVMQAFESLTGQVTEDDHAAALVLVSASPGVRTGVRPSSYAEHSGAWRTGVTWERDAHLFHRRAHAVSATLGSAAEAREEACASWACSSPATESSNTVNLDRK